MSEVRDIAVHTPSDADINHLSLAPEEIEESEKTWLCPHCENLIRVVDATMAERARCLRHVMKYSSNGIARMMAKRIKDGI